MPYWHLMSMPFKEVWFVAIVGAVRFRIGVKLAAADEKSSEIGSCNGRFDVF